MKGTVGWRHQKDAAERCVRFPMGAVAVTNNVAIEPSGK